MAPKLPLSLFGEQQQLRMQVPVPNDLKAENLRALQAIVPQRPAVRQGIRLFYEDEDVFMRRACLSRLPRRLHCRVGIVVFVASVAVAIVALQHRPKRGSFYMLYHRSPS